MSFKNKAHKHMNKKIIFFIIGVILIVLTFLSIENYNINKNKEGLAFGKKNAPIEIVEYSSFQCPDCMKLHNEIGDELKSYIDEGIVKYTLKVVDIKRFEYDGIIYKHLSKSQSKDLNKIEEIFKNQEYWKEMKNVDEVISTLELDSEVNKYNQEEHLWNKEKLDKLDIKSVPTMYINNEKISPKITKNEFINLIEEKLKEKTKNN